MSAFAGVNGLNLATGKPVDYYVDVDGAVMNTVFFGSFLLFFKDWLEFISRVPVSRMLM
jgi:hypothetical protein